MNIINDKKLVEFAKLKPCDVFSSRSDDVNMKIVGFEFNSREVNAVSLQTGELLVYRLDDIVEPLNAVLNLENYKEYLHK